MRDILERAGKTFLETFIVSLCMQIVPVLNDLANVDWANWKIWLLPIVGGCLGSAISVAINTFQNAIKARREKDGGNE